MAMKDLSLKFTDISKPVHVLELFRAVFERMGNRDGVSDPWLQRRVTAPSMSCITRYREGLQLFKEREAGSPTPPKTIRQIFKEDEKIREKVDLIRSAQDAAHRESKAVINSRLFNEADRTPGGLDRFLILVEADVERYGREMESFKRIQEAFDRRHNLIPNSSSMNLAKIYCDYCLLICLFW